MSFLGVSWTADKEAAEREAERQADLRRNAEAEKERERQCRAESEKKAWEAETQKRDEEQRRVAAEQERNQERIRKEEALRKAEQMENEKDEAERRAYEAEQEREKEVKEKEEMQQKQEELQEKLKKLTAKPNAFREVCMDTTELGKMNEELVKSQPYDIDKVPHINILLFGLVGHGKTSFVNTVYSTLSGKVMALSAVGTAEKTVTRKLRKHKLKLKGASKKSELACFRLCDTMGVEGNDGISEKDLSYIMAGHIKDKYEFNPLQPINPESNRFLKDPKLKDKMHCVAICVNAAQLPLLNGPPLEKLKRIKNEVLTNDLSFIIILTNIDGICEIVALDPSKTFHSDKVEEAVRETANIFGVPANQVFPVKNYEKEVKCVPAISSMAIYACQKLVDYANAYIENEVDAESDDD